MTAGRGYYNNMDHMDKNFWFHSILIISSISSFEMNKVNPIPAIEILFPLILLSTLFIAFEAAFEAICLLIQENIFS